MKKSKFKKGNPSQLGGLEQLEEFFDSSSHWKAGVRNCGIKDFQTFPSPLRSPQGRAFDPLVRQEEGKGQREREGERERAIREGRA